MNVSFICVTHLSQLPDHAKVSDPAENYILSLHQHFLIHPTACVCRLRIKEIFAKLTLAASVTNTLFELCSDVIKGWSKMSILIEITNGQPILFMWHLFVLLFFFLRKLALENIVKILTTGPRLLLVMCLLLLFHNFLSGRSANASECCSPVPYTIQ